ncbi:MAG TPA: M23 family metallopeptidase [Bacillota bacterium]|nr:M23 family metallopeptidase [Bacillota bacterium]
MFLGHRKGSQRRIYIVSKKRLRGFLITCILLLMVLAFILTRLCRSPGQYRASQFNSEHLSMYFMLEQDARVPWHYLAAVDLAEGIPPEEISQERSREISLHLLGIKEDEQFPEILAGYRDDKAFLRKAQRELEALSQLRDIFDNKVFPLDVSAEYSYEDGYGDARSYGGDRSHEGIDLMAEIGVPIHSVCDGLIKRLGWNQLGGYRVGIRGGDSIYYYYAHLSSYQAGLAEGQRVKKGQLIGFVGDTGYGPVGTSGQFSPHLHFGMYYGNMGRLQAFNPYPFLRAWEGH